MSNSQCPIEHSSLEILHSALASLVFPHQFRDLLRRHRLDEVVVYEHRCREAAGAETFDLDHGPLSIRTRRAQLLGAGGLEKGLRDRFRSTDVAWGCRADLDEVLPDRMLMVHGVERHD